MEATVVRGTVESSEKVLVKSHARLHLNDYTCVVLSKNPAVFGPTLTHAPQVSRLLPKTVVGSGEVFSDRKAVFFNFFRDDNAVIFVFLE